MKSSSPLVNAARQHDSVTFNGAVTHSTSLNAVVDMFFLAGASRNMPAASMITLFEKAWAEDPLMTMKCLFWSRDVRGGAGERNFFQVLMGHIKMTRPDVYDKVSHLIPEYGYYKDILKIESPDAKNISFLAGKLQSGDGLMAKWFPRKGPWFNAMRKFLKITPKDLRKSLVNNTSVVETKMCNKQWDLIEYKKVPSQAFQRYKKAFLKRDETRFNMFIQRVVDGKETLNSATLFPYQLYQSYGMASTKADNDAIIAQWKNLPDYVGEGSFLPVCDVSGSMIGMPMDISVSLGVYLSERNKGIFKDAFITFSTRPEMQYLKGNVIQRFEQLEKSQWAMSTDLQAVFALILNAAVKNKLKQEDLPENVLIISDMEFNSACDNTNLEAVYKQFAKAGYICPRLVFWNVNGRVGNVPAKADQQDVALVSGASPSIVKNVLSGKDFTPKGVMVETLMSPRYAAVII